MKKIFALAAVAALTLTSACSNFSGFSKKPEAKAPAFSGTFADSCAKPSSKFTFNDGGTGTIQARGQSRNFTWQQKGNIAYVSVPSQGGTPAQTYGLSRTQSGIYLSSLTVNGQTQNLTQASASERTKVKCA